jgi:hypothetical protein
VLLGCTHVVALEAQHTFDPIQSHACQAFPSLTVVTINVVATLKALMINEFTGLEFNCTEDQATFCLETGEAVLLERGMDTRDVWEELGKMLLLTVGFRVAGYLCLRFLHVEKLNID